LDGHEAGGVQHTEILINHSLYSLCRRACHKFYGLTKQNNCHQQLTVDNLLLFHVNKPGYSYETIMCVNRPFVGTIAYV